MDFLTLAKERYSCRDFLEKEVEQEKIEKIIKAGLVAPTAVNKQPYKIWVVESEELKGQMKDISRFTFDAGVFLVVGYKEEEAWVRKYDGRNFADIDASIVATHMMLEVQDLGLGTTWVGHFNAPKLKEICPAMQGYELIAIFPIGYPADDAQPAAFHEVRRPENEMVQRV